MKTHPDKNNSDKLIELALEIEDQIKAEYDTVNIDDSKCIGPSASLHDDAIDALSTDDIEELESARNALAFLGQVRSDINHLTSATLNSTSKTEPLIDATDHHVDSTLGSQYAGHSTLAGDSTLADDLDSTSFGRFQIIDTIGQGGFARVFRAHDPLLEREVALKIPKPQVLVSPESQSRFEREGKAAAMLSHPAIVTVYEAGMVGPINYIASAYCAGETLADWLAKHEGPVSVEESAKIVAKLAEAVHHAHVRGIIHRDLKPSNILIEQGTGELTEQIRITDFGLAKDLSSEDETLTIEGSVIGTPAYMSPEQVRCDPEVGVPTDVYSLGVILYELLTGAPPHRKSGISATIRAVEHESVIPVKKTRSGIPREIEAICHKCLEKNPADRYANAFELTLDLQRFENGQPVSAKAPSSIDRFVKWTKRNPIIAASLAVTFLALTSGVAVSSTLFRQSEIDRIAAVEAKGEAIRLKQEATDSLSLAETRLKEMHTQMELLTSIFDELKSTSVGGFDGKILSQQMRKNLVHASNQIFASTSDARLRSNLASRLGNGLGKLGFDEESLSVTTKALELGRSNGLSDSELLRLKLYVVFSLAVAEEFKQTIVKLNPIIDQVIESPEISTQDKLSALNVLAHCFHNTAMLKKSSKTYKRMLRFYDNVESQQKELPEHKNVNKEILDSKSIKAGRAMAKCRIAHHEFSLDRTDEKLDELLIQQAEYEFVLGPTHFGVIGSANEVAAILGEEKRVEEALEMSEMAYQNSIETFGVSSWQTITSISTMIVICGTNSNNALARKRLPEILPLGREACDAFSKTFKDDNRQLLLVYGNLATAYGITGDYESCIDIKRKLIKISERRFGRKHKLTQNSIFGLGIALQEFGQKSEACELLKEFVDFAEETQEIERDKVRLARQQLEIMQQRNFLDFNADGNAVKD